MNMHEFGCHLTRQRHSVPDAHAQRRPQSVAAVSGAYSASSPSTASAGMSRSKAAVRGGGPRPRYGTMDKRVRRGQSETKL